MAGTALFLKKPKLRLMILIVEVRVEVADLIYDTKNLNSLEDGVYSHRPWVDQPLPHQYPPATAVIVGHLDSPARSVGPVDVVGVPVHGDAVTLAHACREKRQVKGMGILGSLG